MGNLGGHLSYHPDMRYLRAVREKGRAGEVIRFLTLATALAVVYLAYQHGRTDRSLNNDFDARVIELGLTKQLYAAEKIQGNLWTQNHDLNGMVVSMETRLRNYENHLPKQYRAGLENEVAIMERFRSQIEK